MKAIVCVDNKWGISKDGVLPWRDSEVGKLDMRWFTWTTENSTVIMGYNTYLSIGRPLAKRQNIVIYNGDNVSMGCLTNTPVLFVRNMSEAIKQAKCKDKYIIGGAQTYKEALKQQLLSYVYVSFINYDYNCDLIFPHEYLGEYRVLKTGLFELREYDVRSDERKYLDLCTSVLSATTKPNRTGIDTHSLYCQHLQFTLYDNDRMVLPMLTTKRVSFKSILVELMWFLRGDTNISFLTDNNVHIWDANSTREFLDSRGLQYEPGNIGPGYGSQWRTWGGRNVDQISNIIDTIRTDKTSRRMILNAWNAEDIKKMALPPCHFAAQFYFEDDRLCCSLFMRSSDLPLGVPFNIVSYSLLVFILCKITNCQPGKLYIHMTDCHIYVNQVNQVRQLISRQPRKFPYFSFSDRINNLCNPTIDDFTIDKSDYIVTDYDPHPAIKISMAV